MIPIPKEAILNTLSIMKGAPMLLALLLINGATLFMVSHLAIRSAEFRAKERMEMLTTIEHLSDRCSGGKPYP